MSWQTSGNFYLGKQRLPVKGEVAGVTYGPKATVALEDGDGAPSWPGRWVRVGNSGWVVCLYADEMIPETKAQTPEQILQGVAKDCAEADASRDDTGKPLVVVRRFFRDANRYLFDFDLCQYENGWVQLDTPEDAAYLGHWLHLQSCRLVGYVEGDVFVEIAPDAENLRQLCIQTFEHFHGGAIDPGLNPKTRLELERAGFGSLMHPAFEESGGAA